MKKIQLSKSKGKTIEYFIVENECNYEGTKLKCAICYSKTLKELKKELLKNK